MARLAALATLLAWQGASAYDDDVSALLQVSTQEAHLPALSPSQHAALEYARYTKAEMALESGFAELAAAGLSPQSFVELELAGHGDAETKALGKAYKAWFVKNYGQENARRMHRWAVTNGISKERKKADAQVGPQKVAGGTPLSEGEHRTARQEAMRQGAQMEAQVAHKTRAQEQGDRVQVENDRKLREAAAEAMRRKKYQLLVGDVQQLRAAGGSSQELNGHEAKDDLEYERQIRRSDLSEAGVTALLREREIKKLQTKLGDNGEAPKNLVETVSCQEWECPNSFASSPNASALTCASSRGNSCNNQCCVEVPDFFRYDGFYLPKGHDLVGLDLHVRRVRNIDEVSPGNREQMEDFVAKPQLLTVSEAKARCTSSKHCLGFCHEGAADVGERVMMHFKSSMEMYPTLKSAGSWSTYLIQEADAIAVNSKIKSTPSRIEGKRQRSNSGLREQLKDQLPEEMYGTSEFESIVKYEAARASGNRQELEAAERDMEMDGQLVPPRGDVQLHDSPLTYEEMLMQSLKKAEDMYTTTEAPMAAQNPMDEAGPQAGPIPVAEEPKKQDKNPYAIFHQGKGLRAEQKKLKEGQDLLTEQLAQLTEQLASLTTERNAFDGSRAEPRLLNEASAERAQQEEAPVEEEEEEEAQPDEPPMRVEEPVDEDQWLDG